MGKDLIGGTGDAGGLSPGKGCFDCTSELVDRRAGDARFTLGSFGIRPPRLGLSLGNLSQRAPLLHLCLRCLRRFACGASGR